MNEFNPDLIIEATAACDRACPGCYAPNFVTNKTPKEIYQENPGLFLRLMDLNNGFNQMPVHPFQIAIRGGEPTLHPGLSSLLLISYRKAEQVLLETHGRWLLPENIASYSELLVAIKDYKTIIKISFDKMHGLRIEALKQITDTLSQQEIDYRIAITEDNLDHFFETKKLCHWIDEQKIIYQPKAKKASDLIQPNLGVINVKGDFIPNLTNRFVQQWAERYEVAL